MTQMIVHYSFADYATFKSAFDKDAEDRGQNGLSLLQLWRDSGASSTSAWALYQVNNAAAAKEYLSGAAQVFNSQAGVRAVETHLVETA